MTTPYRDQDPSLVQVRGGVCPWCREAVRFAASDTSAVCDRCGARYAPALTTRQDLAPVVVRSRIGLYALIAVVAAAGVVLVSLALALVMVVAVVAFGIYLGLPSRIPSEKQLPAAAEPEADRGTSSSDDGRTRGNPSSRGSRPG